MESYSLIIVTVSVAFFHLHFQGQFRGRTEIAPDQRERFLQRLHQVQQQGPSNILGMAPLGGGNPMQFSAQQQNPLLQQVILVVFTIALTFFPFLVNSLFHNH